MLQKNQCYAPAALSDPVPQLINLVFLVLAIDWFGYPSGIFGRSQHTGMPRILESKLWTSPEQGATCAGSRASSYGLVTSRPPQENGSFIPGAPRTSDLTDPKMQIEAIARVAFEVQLLLSREVARLLAILEAAVQDFGSDHRLMAQTSLDEAIRPIPTSPVSGVAQAARASINSKRLDFAVIDRRGHLGAATDYQGSGHHQHKAFLRDAEKREAVRKAGMPFIGVERDFDTDEIRSRLRRILQPVSRYI